VQWFDFPFWQGRHQKQFIIDLVRSSSDLIAIDHPSRRHSYTPDDVTALTSASYAFAPDDSYVRTVVHGTRTTLFLNPLIRTEGGAPPAPAATIDWPWTTATRSAIVAGCVVVAWLLLSRPGTGHKRV